MEFAKFLRTPILKNNCEKLLLFVSPQNTIALNRVQSIFLNVTILFDQMQPYHLYIS